jgi:hypothetical protein
MTVGVESEIHTIDDPDLAQEIQDSFSAGSIMNGAPIHDPFLLLGELWLCVSANGVGITPTGDNEFEAYRLLPKEAYSGKSLSYAEKICDNNRGDGAFYDPQGIYNGIEVQHDAHTYVLVGPPDIFIVTPEITPRH